MTAFQVLTFGCQMNVNDSEWLSRALTARGLREVPPDADLHAAENAGDVRVVIVNTCSVREKPEQKVYSLLGRLAPFFEKHPNAFAAVCGCVAQQIGESFWSRFPFVRLVFGTDGVAMAPQAVERLLNEPKLRISLLDFTESYPERNPHLDQAASQGKAFVNIMQGCDNYCAYCIVPFVRGRQKSRRPHDVLAECQGLAERGAKEITLLGQNVNSYGQDAGGAGVSFARLLEQTAAIPGLERLRFVTSHPKDIADEVIDAFGRLETLCPSLHLPLQSGSDRVLQAMGRRYDTARYLDIVDRLRRARPEIALTTDLIVGFPGETEAEFQATLDIMERVGFASSFSFMYSDRPGTRAERMDGKLDLAVKAERLEQLQSLQSRLTQAHLESAVDRAVEVLLEGPSKKQRPGAASWRGRDGCGRVVNVSGLAAGKAKAGSIVPAIVTEAKKHSLAAKSIA